MELRFVVCLEYMGILSTINCMASTNTWDNNTGVVFTADFNCCCWCFGAVFFFEGSLQHFQTHSFSYFSLLFTFYADLFLSPIFFSLRFLFVCYAFTFVVWMLHKFFLFVVFIYLLFVAVVFWLPSKIVVVLKIFRFDFLLKFRVLC